MFLITPNNLVRIGLVRIGVELRFAFLCLVILVLASSPARAESQLPPSDAEHPSFVNDIMPVLTSAGCNSGSCHAKAGGGQRGFQLSVLGFDPQDDYERLVKDSSGRRLFPGSPDRSLLLQKASGRVPHGGGIRLVPGSTGYERLRRWIASGAPWQGGSQRDLTGITVEPSSGILALGATQQLTVQANYSDGSTRDVTEFSLFETNNESMAEVTSSGQVSARDIPGRLAVMVRYQGKIAVFTAAVPLGAPVEELPSPRNFVDEHVFSNLKTIGIPPSPVCDDATFLRRVTLDIAGRLPTSEEAADFAASSVADRRDAVIDRLLNSPQYADYFASKWTPLLKNRRDSANDIASNFAFHAWMRDSLLANVPYDQIVRELLAATGRPLSNPPVAWYKRVSDPKEQLEDVAQLFLGVRLQCAQCHHHPFERWSQDDYYSFAAFFSQIGRKPTDTAGEDLIFHKRGMATATNVKSGVALKPAALGDDVGDILPDEDPRLRLANWMSSADNPFFARALVNRYWKHFFKTGLIEPEDDIRDTNPPTNPILLAALEQHFIQSGFDLKDLIRTITRSQAYQLSATPNDHNLSDRQNYSRFYPRRLQAEVLLDAINDMTETRTPFANLPSGTRAIALPDNSYNNSSAFLQVFGRPDSTSVCECERVQSSSLAQTLHLINSNEMKQKLAAGNGRAARLAAADGPVEDKVRMLYQSAFARTPDDEELRIAVQYLTEPEIDESGAPITTPQAVQQRYQDLIWALMNTKEFLFNH